MTAGYPVTLKDVRVEGSYSGIKFVGKLAHGKTYRLLEAVVQPRTILLIAQALLCCPGNMQAPGHAAWHLDHPDRPRPCPERVPVAPVEGAKRRVPRKIVTVEAGGFKVGECVFAKGRKGTILEFVRVAPHLGCPEGKDRALVNFPGIGTTASFDQFHDVVKLKRVPADEVDGFRVHGRKKKA